MTLRALPRCAGPTLKAPLVEGVGVEGSGGVAGDPRSAQAADVCFSFLVFVIAFCILVVGSGALTASARVLVVLVQRPTTVS